MRNDPSYEFRLAIYMALNGNTTYGDNTYQIEMYESMQAPDYYIKVGYPTMIDDPVSKDTYGLTGTLNIEVVNKRFMQRHSAEAEMVDIVNDINGYVVKQSLSLSNFVFYVTPYVIGYETIESIDVDRQNEIRKIITYTFIIAES